MEKILVLFKTHLDVGFTDFSENIVKKYNEEYIPKAINVARTLSGTNEGFTWTTGSWLIWQYLKNADAEKKAEMEEAIRNKWISWHGLPVTFHSECMSSDLFSFGLGLSKQLDEKYGRKTVAAKYTDVPGHTVGIVPLLAKAGIKLLHIGVNPASCPPDVPDMFIWRAPTGEEVTVIYNKGYYGEFFEIPGSGTGVLFAHTNDNLGPQSAKEISEIYRKIHLEHPEAEIVSGDLNDLAALIEGCREGLPIIEQEIGDTWIHGIGTDPKKISVFRELERRALLWDEKDRSKLFESILMIPEHTWGLDEKTHLNDHKHFSKAKFDKVKTSEKYRRMEKSWLEQREYITKCSDRLSPMALKELNSVIGSYYPVYPDIEKLEKIGLQGKYRLGDYFVTIGADGSVTEIQNGDKMISGNILSFEYEVFSEKEVLAFGERYMSHKYDWALEDFGKIGLSKDIDKYMSCTAELAGVFKDGERLIVKASPQTWACAEYGCPRELILTIFEGENSLNFEFSWFKKDALRIPEALWLRFNPSSKLLGFTKLGTEIDPTKVISNGNRENHGTDGEISFENCTVSSIDTGLISIGKKGIYAFHNQQPDLLKGIYFNLYNNQWGTNFPMWYYEDAKFRFALSI